MRNTFGRRGRWVTVQPEIWSFVLAETLPQWGTPPDVPVDAYRLVYDPSLNSGWGGFAVDCDQPMKVADWYSVGFFGIAGAPGWAEMHGSDNGDIGIIRGLVCPDSCVCGTDFTETAPCVT
jgi:hypothetical protein